VDSPLVHIVAAPTVAIVDGIPNKFVPDLRQKAVSARRTAPALTHNGAKLAKCPHTQA
jgi:hypothetical protein